ncbi:unnamed protein product [Leptidea sinapis]|uniref:Uncharacterized protein n=1 Tax=Leptidea sinapis TaxID=189913 RepID=A0A5E4QEG1_9NEOP|nr:unnamed protein product [Leptidea sinapis]
MFLIIPSRRSVHNFALAYDLSQLVESPTRLPDCQLGYDAFLFASCPWGKVCLPPDDSSACAVAVADIILQVMDIFIPSSAVPIGGRSQPWFYASVKAASSMGSRDPNCKVLKKKYNRATRFFIDAPALGNINHPPHMEYCHHLWSCAPQYQLDPFERIQRRAARIVGDPVLCERLEHLALRRDIASLCDIIPTIWMCGVLQSCRMNFLVRCFRDNTTWVSSSRQRSCDPYARLSSFSIKKTLVGWMRAAQDRSSWRSFGEASVQHRSFIIPTIWMCGVPPQRDFRGTFYHLYIVIELSCDNTTWACNTPVIPLVLQENVGNGDHLKSSESM